MCLPKRIPNMPTQESVDHVWRILLDPPALSGLACWQEEDRYGILHDIVWVYSFWSSSLSNQAACFVKKFFWNILSVLYERHFQFSSVAQLCPTSCDPMNCSTPGLPVHHQLPESTQTHVHWVGDAIQPSHPLSSPSPSALNLSQHQGLFKWVRLRIR